MKRLIPLLCIAVLAGPVLADWEPADGHKMHFPQLPDEDGWDVNATWPVVLADDWECSRSGWVKDIHFWGSWKGGVEGVITSFKLSIHADIPDPDGSGPLYSMPGELLWEQEVLFENVDVVGIDPPVMEGWYNPDTEQVLPNDHQAYFQYNIHFPETQDLFKQKKGTIYWLKISAVVVSGEWGWKSSVNHWNDDAVWAVDPTYDWVDLYEPEAFTQSLDLAFVITGDPFLIPTVSEWGLIVMTVLFLTAGTIVFGRRRRLRVA